MILKNPPLAEPPVYESLQDGKARFCVQSNGHEEQGPEWALNEIPDSLRYVPVELEYRYGGKPSRRSRLVLRGSECKLSSEGSTLINSKVSSRS